MPKTITIQVHNAEGDMTVTPSLVHVRQRDSVTWKLHVSHAGKLALAFADGDAFGATNLGGQGADITATAGTKPGAFHYHVVVDLAAGGPVPPGRYQDNHCPTIIIR